MTARGSMTGKELDELSKLQTLTGLTKDRLYRLFDQSNLKSDPPSLRNPADVTIARVSGMPGRCKPYPKGFYDTPPEWGWPVAKKQKVALMRSHPLPRSTYDRT